MMDRPFICIAGKNNIAVVDTLKYIINHYRDNRSALYVIGLR